MKAGLKITGAPSYEELAASPIFSGNEKLKAGPAAFLECLEEIPCNPCETACPHGAIHVGEPITNLPKIDLDACIGCGICISACPGLAIYVKDYTYAKTMATLSFPFEYWPFPEVGSQVEVVGRHGEYLCDGTVLKIRNGRKSNGTAVITVEYPKKWFDEAISIRRIK